MNTSVHEYTWLCMSIQECWSVYRSEHYCMWICVRVHEYARVNLSEYKCTWMYRSVNTSVCECTRVNVRYTWMYQEDKNILPQTVFRWKYPMVIFPQTTVWFLAVLQWNIIPFFCYSFIPYSTLYGFCGLSWRYFIWYVQVFSYMLWYATI